MNAVTIRSLKDCAMQSAASAEVLINAAQYALDNIPGFPEDCPKEHRAELRSGWLLRFVQNNPAKRYARVGETWVLAESLTGDAKPAETVDIDANVAMSYSTHEVGKMADTHGASYKAIIAGLREKFSTYDSNRFGDLKRAAKRIVDEKNGGRKRTQSADWIVWLKDDWLPMVSSRCKTASGRGDTTADQKVADKVRAAVLAALK